MTDTLTRAAHAFSSATGCGHVDAVAAIEAIRAYVTEPAKAADETVETLRLECERLRFALQWYADPANRISSVHPVTKKRMVANVRARKALAWKAKP